MLRQPKIEVVDEAHLNEVLATKAPDKRFARLDLLTIQYTKLINYFRQDVSPQWGGVDHEHESENIEAGFRQFLQDCDAYGADTLPRWLHKKLPSLPWSAENFRLSFTTNPELGYPIEPYLTLNGAILTVHQASRILCIDADALIGLKCSLLLDLKVVDHAIRKMLSPRPQWPRIRLRRGGKGRSYRLA